MKNKMNNDITIDPDGIREMPNDSITDGEMIRQIALYANKTQDTSLFCKIKKGFEVAGLYPEVITKLRTEPAGHITIKERIKFEHVRIHPMLTRTDFNFLISLVDILDVPDRAHTKEGAMDACRILQDLHIMAKYEKKNGIAEDITSTLNYLMERLDISQEELDEYQYMVRASVFSKGPEKTNDNE